jgi:hypothetical protein
MKSIDDDMREPDGTSNGMHINVLEFITMIIELWFIIIIIKRKGPFPGGYIVQLIGDNTTAISWLRYAARSHHPIVRELSHFAMALTLSCPYSLEQTSQRERESGGRCIVPTKRFSNLGLRYTTALPSLELSSLSGPL